MLLTGIQYSGNHAQKSGKKKKKKETKITGIIKYTLKNKVEIVEMKGNRWTRR